jgi:hypothetical protein
MCQPWQCNLHSVCQFPVRLRCALVRFGAVITSIVRLRTGAASSVVMMTFLFLLRPAIHVRFPFQAQT